MRYIENKTLSSTSEYDEILIGQGVGWVTRKTLTRATVTLYITDPPPLPSSPSGVESFEISKSITGGMKGTTENRVLDNIERGPLNDPLLGDIVNKSKRLSKTDLMAFNYAFNNLFLWEGLEDESFAYNGGIILSEDWSWTQTAVRKWRTVQVWGIIVINGDRKLINRVCFTDGEGGESC
ncbi:hypothetical protein TWF694_006562 [Orbilia ellipsospora]|uniref:Uncharacterized protein n=1 Tax=Orbilia ellipsospora TaxID=2528407 RepID=A0AAV9XKL9_9PEZI